MKLKLFLIFSFSLLNSCTILDKSIGLHAPNIVLNDKKELKITKIGKTIEANICNRVYFIIPTSNKNQFDAFDELLTKNPPYNALVEARVKTTFFLFPLVYTQVCHEVSGMPIMIEGN